MKRLSLTALFLASITYTITAIAYFLAWLTDFEEER